MSLFQQRPDKKIGKKHAKSMFEVSKAQRKKSELKKKQNSKISGFSFGYQLPSIFIEKELIRNPGPGEYRTTKNTWDKNTTSRKFELFTKGDRFKQTALRHLAPSPERYNPQYYSKSQRVEFQKEKKKPFYQKATTGNLGPGTYSKSKRSGQPNVKGGIMGAKRKATFFSTDADIPGPQRYDQPDFTMNQIAGPKYYAGHESRSLKNALPNPGPSRYNTDIAYESDYMIGPGFPKAPRDNPNSNEQQPGPGKYDYSAPQLQRKRCAVMGTQARKGAYRINAAPGPGKYFLTPKYSEVLKQKQLESSRRRKSYGMAMSKRENPGQKYLYKPGPKYNIRLKSYSQRSGFGKESKKMSILSKELLEVPGAGEYDVRESYQVVMGKNVGKKFLTGKRPGLINVKKQEKLPGPGSYTIPSIFDRCKKKPKRKRVMINGLYQRQKQPEKVTRKNMLSKNSNYSGKNDQKKKQSKQVEIQESEDNSQSEY